MKVKGLVGNINRYALNDGPGIRTTVFFKGCQLHCPWCHNPELISSEPTVAFLKESCILCGDCLTVCPEAAIHMIGENRINRDRCNSCGLCVKMCPSAALKLVGTEYELEELVEILLRDRLFYEESGGGVTLSGGEPTQQLTFIGSLLTRLQAEGIHTAIETNGLFSFDLFASTCLDHLDLILFDVKFADTALHKQVVGKGNEVIINNLARLLEDRFEDILVRIPLIPGYTAEHENITRISELLHGLKVERYSLLPYHSYGINKARTIGYTPDKIIEQHPMNQEELVPWQKFFHDMKIITP